jgi:cytochrome c-type biogenesis protein CcmH
MFKKFGFAFLVLLCASAFSGTFAQDSTPPSDNDVNRVAKKLYCPVCENVPLDVCPTLACAQWRATIREKLQAGWSEQQILNYFVEQYGERVLAQPSARGANVLVWVIPPIVIALGAFGLWRFLRTASPPRPVGAAQAVSSDEYTQRLEKELQERF